MTDYLVNMKIMITTHFTDHFTHFAKMVWSPVDLQMCFLVSLLFDHKIQYRSTWMENSI